MGECRTSPPARPADDAGGWTPGTGARSTVQRATLGGSVSRLSGMSTARANAVSCSTEHGLAGRPARRASSTEEKANRAGGPLCSLAAGRFTLGDS